MPFFTVDPTSRPGKFRYNTFYVFSIIMNFVNFALGVDRSLALLVSVLEALSFKRSGAPSEKHTKTALVSVHNRFNIGGYARGQYKYKLVCSKERVCEKRYKSQ